MNDLYRFGESMKLEEWSIKNCWICGEPFIIKTNLKTRKILTPCFHSYIHKHHFMGWSYQLLKDRNFKVKFKNAFWKVIAFTKVQRWIIYGVWKLFFGWQMLEYWECDNCNNSKGD